MPSWKSVVRNGRGIDGFFMDSRADNFLLHNSLSQQAQQQPDHIALVCEGSESTYADLEFKSNQVAHAIRAAGYTAPDRVAILDINSVNYVEVIFGAAKSGCSLVPINSRLAAPEVAYILRDSGCQILFAGREHYQLVESIQRDIDCQIIALDGEHGQWEPFQTWRDRSPGTPLSVDIDVDDDVVQLYTSGTTGHPKGVCHTHRTLHESITAASDPDSDFDWACYTPDTRNLVCLPLFHVAGFNLVRYTFSGGGQVVLTRAVDPDEILSLIPASRVTDCFLVPSVIQAVVSHPKAAHTDFSSMKRMSYGAAPIADTTLALAQRTLGAGCSFQHLYGMTENLGMVTCLPNKYHTADSGKLRSCGLPYAGVDVKIVDPEGAEVGAGEVGEIVARTPWSMRCYWQNPEATAETLHDDGWLFTGDAGFLDEDGFLYIHDRVKDMIISGGENIYPAEVENALFSFPDIADAAVIGVSDEKWGESVKAVVVLKRGKDLDEQALESHVRESIAGYKIPRSYEVVDALPRNASGKVLRRKLREIYSES